MMISEYKLVSDKISGEIIFTYNGDVLFSIVFKLSKPLSVEQFAWLCGNMLYSEKVLKGRNDCFGTVQLKRVTPMTAADKMTLFCNGYKQYIKDVDGNPVEYIRQKMDHLMLKSFEVNELLLRTYFTSDKVLFKGNYSVGNYTKFYNQLRAEAAGANKKSKFPNHYDAGFVKRCSGNEVGEYYKHLHSLGLKPKKNHFNDIIDFIPDGSQQTFE